MQRAALAGSEAAALFLATHGAKVNHVNKWVCINILIFHNQTWCLCPSEEFKFQCQSHVLKSTSVLNLMLKFIYLNFDK